MKLKMWTIEMEAMRKILVEQKKTRVTKEKKVTTTKVQKEE